VLAALLTFALSAAHVAAPPPSEPASLVLIVASNRGVRAGRAPLQYADDDGAKYHEVFSTIAGEDRTFLLTDFDRDTARLFPALLERVRSPTRAQLDVVVRKLAGQAAELRRAGRSVRFYFVFAGHGDVDGGRGFLELADGPLTADELQQLLRTVEAAESHVILDSCNSFFVVNPRKPGGSRFATPRDAAEALARRLPNVGVFLSTSAQAEVYEWSELQSGVFSHAVRSGLLGAADASGDGRVSYDELAAFVDTAVAAIKNPGFRPRVFARGPNGEDGRAILDLPPTRTALLVDEPVRLAVRDLEGLRWLDAHTEAGSRVRLWFPPSIRGRLEVDRLSLRRQGAHVDASLSLPDSEPALPLSALGPSGTTVAMRGVGEIFEALFARPFGPEALAGWLSARPGSLEGLLGMEPSPAVPPREVAESCDTAISAPVWDERGRRPFAQLRAGATVPRLTSAGRLSTSDETTLGAGLGLAAGVELNAWAAAEVEVAYHRLAATSDFFSYPNPSSPYTPVVGTRIGLQVVPLALAIRMQLPALRPVPYLMLGGGSAWVGAVLDPPDFNATLRAGHFVSFLQVGVGAQIDLSERIYLGFEARYLHLSDFRAFESTLRLGGLTTSALLGVRR
jgi:hypothetical protein